MRYSANVYVIVINRHDSLLKVYIFLNIINSSSCSHILSFKYRDVSYTNTRDTKFNKKQYVFILYCSKVALSVRGPCATPSNTTSCGPATCIDLTHCSNVLSTQVWLGVIGSKNCEASRCDHRVS